MCVDVTGDVCGTWRRTVSEVGQLSVIRANIATASHLVITASSLELVSLHFYVVLILELMFLVFQ